MFRLRSSGRGAEPLTFAAGSLASVQKLPVGQGRPSVHMLAPEDQGALRPELGLDSHCCLKGGPKSREGVWWGKRQWVPVGSTSPLSATVCSSVLS